MFDRFEILAVWKKNYSVPTSQLQYQQLDDPTSEALHIITIESNQSNPCGWGGFPFADLQNRKQVIFILSLRCTLVIIFCSLDIIYLILLIVIQKSSATD